MNVANHLNGSANLPGLPTARQEAAEQLAALWVRLGPHVELEARLAFRHLAGEKREDMIQECRALGCKWAARLLERGRDPMVFRNAFCRYLTRAVACGRTAARRGTGRCPLDPTVQHRHGISVHGLPIATRTHLAAGYRSGRAQHWLDEWETALAEHDRATPAEQVAFRVDFRHWLRRLAPRDRKVIRLLIRGERCSVIAATVDVSPGRISQLRREWAHSWALFQGERV